MSARRLQLRRRCRVTKSHNFARCNCRDAAGARESSRSSDPPARRYIRRNRNNTHTCTDTMDRTRSRLDLAWSESTLKHTFASHTTFWESRYASFWSRWIWGPNCKIQNRIQRSGSTLSKDSSFSWQTCRESTVPLSINCYKLCNLDLSHIRNQRTRELGCLNIPVNIYETSFLQLTIY